jgi:hypothetical protein
MAFDLDWHKPLTPKQKLIKRLGGKCVYCNATENLTIDHIIPQSLTRILGVDRDKDNLQVLCYDCNNRKGDSLKSNDPVTVEILDRMINQWKFLHGPKPNLRRKYVFRTLSVTSLTPTPTNFVAK